MERDCCPVVCGASTTMQCYGMEQHRIISEAKNVVGRNGTTNLQSNFNILFSVIFIETPDMFSKLRCIILKYIFLHREILITSLLWNAMPHQQNTFSCFVAIFSIGGRQSLNIGPELIGKILKWLHARNIAGQNAVRVILKI